MHINDYFAMGEETGPGLWKHPDGVCRGVMDPLPDKCARYGDEIIDFSGMDWESQVATIVDVMERVIANPKWRGAEMMFGDRPVNNSEMHGYLLWTRYSLGAKVARWVANLLEWIGVTNDDDELGEDERTDEAEHASDDLGSGDDYPYAQGPDH